MKSPTLPDSGLPVSVLDLVGMKPNEPAGEAITRSIDLAQHTEKLGYTRYWLAEHHSIAGLACSATAVLIGHVAAATKTMRIGSGGIMLPNHAPLVIAEQFGTLEAIYPGRIDLGLGRAPGGDFATMQALRRDLAQNGDDFPALLEELQTYLGPARQNQRVHAYPGQGSNVPITLLGSSTFSAMLAASKGLPFAFASHFAPALLDQALAIYRDRFQPSEQLQRPYAMAALSVFAAETDEEAQVLATSQQQAFVNLRTGRAGPLPPPRAGYIETLPPQARALIEDYLSCAVIGGPDAVGAGLQAFAARTGADELIVTCNMFDFDKRMRSFEIAAQAYGPDCSTARGGAVSEAD